MSHDAIDLTLGAKAGPLVLATVVRLPFELAVASGVDRATLLARIGVKHADELSEPERLLPFDAFPTVWEAIAELPGARTLALKLAELRRADNDGAAVERALNRGFVLAPGNGAVSNALVAELISRGGFARAVEVLERALEHTPRDASLHLRLAEALQKSGDSERALLALDAAAAAGANATQVRRERAHILEALGRGDEALELTDETERISATDDLDPQVRGRLVRARALARRGELEAADALLREAATIVEPTDFVALHLELAVAQADVDRLAGRPESQRRALERALEIAEAQGSVVDAERVRGLLAEL